MFKCTCRNVSVQVQVWKCQCVKCKCRSVSVQEIFRKNPSQCFREQKHHFSKIDLRAIIESNKLNMRINNYKMTSQHCMMAKLSNLSKIRNQHQVDPFWAPTQSLLLHLFSLFPDAENELLFYFMGFGLWHPTTRAMECTRRHICKRCALLSAGKCFSGKHCEGFFRKIS